MGRLPGGARRTAKGDPGTETPPGAESPLGMTLPAGEELSGPQALSDQHDLTSFDCEETSLNDWLRRRARANQITGASRTFVVCAGPTRVVGYYSLSVCSILHVQ